MSTQVLGTVSVGSRREAALRARNEQQKAGLVGCGPNVSMPHAGQTHPRVSTKCLHCSKPGGQDPLHAAVM